MLSGTRAAALLVFAGLFAATFVEQAEAASSTAAASSQDDSALSRLAEAAKLRALTAVRQTVSSRKLLTKQFSNADLEKLIADIMAVMEKNNGKLTAKDLNTVMTDDMPDVPDPYHGRRSLMGLPDLS